MESFERKVVDNLQSRQFSPSETQLVSTEIQGQTMNKNIEILKKLNKTKEMFDKIYNTFNVIAVENDFDAMNFGVKEKFCEVKNKIGETVFDRAIKESNTQLARLIIEFSGNSNNIYGFCNDTEFLRFIQKIPHFDANKSLINASNKGHIEVIKLILTIPKIDINAQGKYNRSALMWASRNGYPDIVNLLLTVPSINVNATDIATYSSLILASAYGNHEVVKLLLSVPEINVGYEDEDSENALTVALEEDHKEVVKLLAVPLNKIFH